MLFEAEFWVLVAFVLFMGVVAYMGAFTKALGNLDARGKRIQAELDEAKRLREEASHMLADYTRRRNEAETEAASIVAAARQDAERVAQEAHERLSDFVTRRTAAAEARISQAEAQAAQQVRSAAADAAIRISETILRDDMRGATAEDLLSKSLSDVGTKLHA